MAGDHRRPVVDKWIADLTDALGHDGQALGTTQANRR